MAVIARYVSPLASVKCRMRRPTEANAPMYFLQFGRAWSMRAHVQRDETGCFVGNCAGELYLPLLKGSAAVAFATRVQTLAADMTATHDVLFRFCFFAAQHPSDVTIGLIDSGQTTREALVNLALRLNVLAVCAVFAFVGAVLLGAF